MGGGNTSSSIIPADGNLVELKVDDSNLDGLRAEHFSDGTESPYDATVSFNMRE